MIHLEDRVNVISELDDIDELVRLYWPRVLRYVTFSIGDRDLAESITQDCFLKAYKGRASFRGDCAVSTWLIGIANNLVRDQLRLKKFQFWRKANATLAGHHGTRVVPAQRRKLSGGQAAGAGAVGAGEGGVEQPLRQSA